MQGEDNNQFEDVVKDMFHAGFSLILPSKVSVGGNGAAGSYSVLTDTLTADPSDFEPFEAIIAHELIHSTQESIEFGPMSVEEHKWISEKLEDYRRELDCVQGSGVAKDNRIVLGYLVNTELEEDLKWEIGRRQHELREIERDLRALIEEAPVYGCSENGLDYDSGVYFTDEDKKENVEEYIDRIEELKQKRSEIKDDLVSYVNDVADERKGMLEEGSPAENPQVVERIEKWNKLNDPDDKTRAGEEVMAYLVSDVYESEDPDGSDSEEVIENIRNGVVSSTAYEEVPQYVKGVIDRFVSFYEERREEFSDKRAAASTAELDYIKRRETLLVSD
ncbi:MAG: hypothetical protein ABEJ72_07380 [Candidatus Aenigmatarchaeota archaeon]